MQLGLLSRPLVCRVIPAVTVFFASMMPAFAVPEEGKLSPSTIYKIVHPVYLMAVYESLDDKRDKKEPARAYLQPERYAKTRWVAFQCEVPIGTIMTVIGPAPPAKDLWNRYDAYYVHLRPDPSRHLEMIVQLFRGFADTSGGLSRKFFEPVNGQNDETAEETGCIEPKH